MTKKHIAVEYLLRPDGVYTRQLVEEKVADSEKTMRLLLQDKPKTITWLDYNPKYQCPTGLLFNDEKNNVVCFSILPFLSFLSLKVNENEGCLIAAFPPEEGPEVLVISRRTLYPMPDGVKMMFASIFGPNGTFDPVYQSHLCLLRKGPDGIQIHHPGTTNVHDNGVICTGTAMRNIRQGPQSLLSNHYKALKAFMESAWTNHLQRGLHQRFYRWDKNFNPIPFDLKSVTERLPIMGNGNLALVARSIAKNAATCNFSESLSNLGGFFRE
jgi:hypothetical protein